MATVMAIAAHPGDAVFTMGGVVAQHVQNGGKGVFVSLSLGERGAPADIPVERYGEMQRAASEKAAKLLGAELELLTYPDAAIPFNDQAALEVCDAVRRHKPDAVITHWSGSWHKDHQNKPLRWKSPARLYKWPNRSLAVAAQKRRETEPRPQGSGLASLRHADFHHLWWAAGPCGTPLRSRLGTRASQPGPQPDLRRL